MNVLDGAEQISTNAADFEMESLYHDKVMLPYIGKLWGDLQLEVMRLIFLSKNSSLDNVQYDQLVDDVAVNMSFNIQRKAVRIIAYLIIALKDGDVIDGSVFIQAGVEELRSILDNFFAVGGKGLDPAYLPHYAQTYRVWAAQ